MNKKLYITIGCPGSGKTTWAKALMKTDKNIKRVNKDLVRLMLNNEAFNKEFESVNLSIYKIIVESLMPLGYPIVLDNTHLNISDFKYYNKLATIFGYELEFMFFPIELEEAIERDSKRENPVGEEVIKNMWIKYQSLIKDIDIIKGWEIRNEDTGN